MSLDISKLVRAKRRRGAKVARCPACAEQGHDRSGEHLFVTESGASICVVYPGYEGHTHRQRIFELAGLKEKPCHARTAKKPIDCSQDGFKIIKKDILGHLGHLNSTSARSGKELITDKDVNKDVRKDMKITVPTVPTKVTPAGSNGPLNTADTRYLEGMDEDAAEKLRHFMRVMKCKVVGVVDLRSDPNG